MRTSMGDEVCTTRRQTSLIVNAIGAKRPAEVEGGDDGDEMVMVKLV